MSLWYLNKDRLVAIHLKLSGPDPLIHDCLEICAVVLDDYLDKDHDISPFQITLHSRNTGSYDERFVKFNKVDTEKAYIGTCDFYDATNYFMRWYDKINPNGDPSVQLQLVGYDLAIQYEWLRAMFLDDLAKAIFSPIRRDIKELYGYCQDRGHFTKTRIPFNTPSVESMANKLGVTQELRGDCANTLFALMQIYKSMMSI